MVLGVQYLRGIAAILVILYHARGLLNINGNNLGDFIFGWGYFGVDIFFIISGFVIVLATQKDADPISYIIKRFFRIYPLYIFVIFIYVAFSMADINFELLRSLFFIQHDYSKPAPWFGYSTNIAAWTLTYEVFFYILFLFGMIISHKYRVIVTSIFISMAVIGINLTFNGQFSISGYYQVHNVNGIIKLLSSPMFLEFIIGMLFAEIYLHKEKFKINLIPNELIILVAINSFVWFYFNNVVSGHGLKDGGLYAAILVFCAVIYKVKEKKNKLLYLLGEMSYSIYLTHLLIFSLYQNNNPGSPLNPFGNLIVEICLVLLVSYITYNIIEKPSIYLARKIIKRTKSKFIKV